MDNLDIERRQVEYERLGMTLREKVSKMRKLEAALPVLVFSLNDEGKVVEVGVDSKRSKTKLTRRSRGLMLKALRDERFRLPVRQYLEEPHALAEKLQRFGLRYRVGQLGNGLIWAGRPVARPFRALLYRKVILHGRCGETRIEWMPRFWRLH